MTSDTDTSGKRQPVSYPTENFVLACTESGNQVSANYIRRWIVGGSMLPCSSCDECLRTQCRKSSLPGFVELFEEIFG